MVTAIKTEFLKLLTVRSTYIFTGLILALVTFLSIYVFGYQQASQKATSPTFVADTVYSMIGMIVIAVVILSILLVAHEYRYNTILYTFTLNRSRLKVLLSKVLVMMTYALFVGVVTIAIAYFGAKFGLSLRGVSLSPQEIPLAQLAWQYLAYLWGYALVGIILAVIIRGLVGSIVAFFVIPTAEGLLSLILKDNTKYLPFRSLDAIAAPVMTMPVPGFGNLANTTALAVFSVYLAIFGLIATLLFIKRDAS